MTSAKVQISVSLLEKLGGIKKELQPRHHKQQQQQQQQHHRQGLSLGALGLPTLPPELAAAAAGAGGSFHAADSGLQQSIQASRRVGELLLKAEDREVAAVKQRSQELLQQYSAGSRPEPCSAEQLAALGCYQQHPQDVLKCSGLVDAYAACAAQAAGQLMT